LKKRNIQIAAASRTEAPDLAREMLKLIRVPLPPTSLSSSNSTSTTFPNTNTTLSSQTTLPVASTSQSIKALDLFTHLQIYPGSKIRHFEKLHKDTGLGYDEMLFFDDESRNRDTERLGVVMWLVRDGVCGREVDEGVRSWRKRNRRTMAEN
jgi:magnesium-dependent phosphatase 1